MKERQGRNGMEDYRGSSVGNRTASDLGMDRESIRSRVDAVIRKYKLDVTNRRRSSDLPQRCESRGGTKTTKCSAEKEVSAWGTDSMRQTPTNCERSREYVNKENDNSILGDFNFRSIREYPQEDINSRSHICCNNSQNKIIIEKIDKLDNFMKMHSSLISHQIQGILDILYNLKQEVDYVRNSIQINEFLKHTDKFKHDKETQTLTDMWLVTFNKENSSLDSVKWKCTESLYSKSPENDCSDNSPNQRILSKNQYENKLKDVSSMASVFNLSQTFERKEHNVNRSGKQKPNFEYEAECRLDPEIKIQEMSSESLPFADSYKSNNTIKTQIDLDVYLKQLKSASLMDECDEMSPKFISFLDKLKQEEIRSSTLSSIPTEIERVELKDTCNFELTQRENGVCNSHCNSTFRDQTCECIRKVKQKNFQSSKFK